MELQILFFLLFISTFISTGFSNDEFTSTSSSSEVIKPFGVNISHSKTESVNSELLPRSSSQHDPQLSPYKDKIFSIDLASIHKHRRNNGDSEDTYRQLQNINTYSSHRNMARPDRHENNIMQQTSGQGYFTERPGAYPVNTQSCEQLDNHVMKNPYHDNQNHVHNHNNYDNNGFVPSWFAAGNRWDWKSKLNENRGQNINPNHITIAMAKIPFSQNRQYSNIDRKEPNININHQNYNYDKSHVPVNIKNYDRNNFLANSQESINDYGYNNVNNKDDVFNRNMFNHHYEMEQQKNKLSNHATVTQQRPHTLNKNQRIIYYEYEDNLDNIRNRQNNQNTAMQNNIVPCGSNYGYPPCEDEINVNHHHHHKQIQLKNENRFNEAVKEGQRPQIRFDKNDVRYSNNMNPFYNMMITTMAPQGFSYHRNNQFGIGGQSTEEHNYRKPPNSGIGQGYVYTIDMPRDRENIPGAIPSVYMTQYPFSKSQYLFNEPSDTRNSDGFTLGNYYH